MGTSKFKNSLERFYSYIFYDFNGCWRWTNRLDRDGYGKFYDNRHYSSHKYSYLIHKGIVPEGMTIDHLCRVRDCVNPQHLEVKTSRENTLCGEGITAKLARRTHCSKNHEYTEENTEMVGNTRNCKLCYSRTGIKGSGQYNKLKTVCRNGHEYTTDNVKYSKQTKHNKTYVARICKTCSKINNKKYKNKELPIAVNKNDC